MGFNLGGLIKGVGKAVTAPIEAVGAGVKEIPGLKKLGQGIQDFGRDDTVRIAAGLAAGYYGVGALNVYKASIAAGASTADAVATAISTSPESFGLAGAAGTGIGGAAGKNALPWLVGGGALLAYGEQTEAAKKAAEAELKATGSSNDLLNLLDLRNRADFAPWRESGVEGLNELRAKILAGPGEFEERPGYKFRLGEGLKAIERSAAAKGGLLSGRTGKALQRYGQEFASNEYQNWLNDYYNSLVPYQYLEAAGRGAATTTADLGARTGMQQAQNVLAGGQIRASRDINTANALTGAVNSGLNNYLKWKYLGEDLGG